MNRNISAIKSLSLTAFCFGIMFACGSTEAPVSNTTSNLEASCEPQGKCEDWNTSKLQGCKNDANDLQKKATAQGCGKQLEAFVTCDSSRAKCIAGKYDKGGCAAELESLTKCANGTPSSSGTSGTSGTPDIHCCFNGSYYACPNPQALSKCQTACSRNAQLDDQCF
jgi:hypothetical protein